jgi:hypothetical protein
MGVPSRVRAMKLCRLALTPAICLLVALSIEHGPIAAQTQTVSPLRQTAGEPEKFIEGVGRIRRSAVEKRNEFILRAPANRVEAIARRHGLTVIGPVKPDSNVFLVEGPARFGRRFDRIRDDDGPALEQLVGNVRGDNDVQHFELNAAVVTPELASGLSLNQTTAAIENALTDRTIVDYFGTQVWKGYVTQPAAAAIRLAASQDAAPLARESSPSSTPASIPTTRCCRGRSFPGTTSLPIRPALLPSGATSTARSYPFSTARSSRSSTARPCRSSTARPCRSSTMSCH